jgi:acylphosphatase
MLQARRFVVSGRVQAVGFRAFVYERALQEGITGFVRNLRDGRVEVMAEGDSEAMQLFEIAVRRGPAAARVDEVEVDVLPPTGRGVHFMIRG